MATRGSTPQVTMRRSRLLQQLVGLRVYLRRELSGDRSEILSQDPGVSRSDAQQRERGTFWSASILLPVAERVNADTHGSSEAGLGQTDESSQGGDVIARFESALDQAFADASWNGPCELLCGELGDVSHVCFFR